MAEENSSWLRRAKFSHTVCHRLDTYRTSSFPIAPRPECDFRLKHSASSSTLVDQPSRRVKLDSIPRKFSSDSDNNPPNLTRRRSISPVSETVLSETFKEARSERKRFSTPYPSRKEENKGIVGKVFHRDTHHSLPADSLPSSSSIPHHRFLSMKISGKSKTRKESSWAKYFHHEGGRVSAATEEWTVDLSKLLLGPKFASGAYSRLYHGIYKDEPVAVKMIMIPDDDENGALAARLEKQFTSEVALLSHLHHKHVIKLVAACRKLPVFCIITEYLEGGSLRAYLHKLERKTLPLEKIIAISLDIARGMEYVHSQGVIHRDLKPENILLDENFCLKIADFGIACEEAYCDSLADDPGTYRWMAPEMIKHKPYGRKVDVYSFGLILWELLTGTIPYEERSPIQAAFAVVNKNLRPTIPAHCPAALHALIEQCWGLHPEKRPGFWEIVKVLEQFESSLARDGTLHLVPTTSSCHDHKKGVVHWIHKLSHSHVNIDSPFSKLL